jgi:site-specific DNA recombinase
VNLKRCGIEMKLIVPNGEQPKAHPITIRALQEAVRKALLWNQALVTGQAASLRELATQEHVTPSYIGTLIKLAFLAPDIIEAIVRGEVPVELSLDCLKKGFPLDWQAQRKTLGFSG